MLVYQASDCILRAKYSRPIHLCVYYSFMPLHRRLFVLLFHLYSGTIRASPEPSVYHITCVIMLDVHGSRRSVHARKK